MNFWSEPTTQQPKRSLRNSYFCCFMLENQRCHTVILNISFSLLLSSEGVGVACAGAKVALRFRKRCWAFRKSPAHHAWHVSSCAGSSDRSNSVSPLRSLAGFGHSCFQTKPLLVFQLLANECHAFTASDIKVLEICFESEAKKIRSVSCHFITFNLWP